MWIRIIRKRLVMLAVEQLAVTCHFKYLRQNSETLAISKTLTSIKPDYGDTNDRTVISLGFDTDYHRVGIKFFAPCPRMLIFDLSITLNPHNHESYRDQLPQADAQQSNRRQASALQ